MASKQQNIRLVALTALAIGLGWYVYAQLEWAPLRKAILAGLFALGRLAGHPLTVDGMTASLGGASTFIGPDCTYMQWVATALPLLWRRVSLGTNLLIACAAVALCQLVNLLRIYAALLATANGAPWFWAHDIPDYTIWYGSVAVLAFAWAGRLEPAKPIGA